MDDTVLHVEVTDVNRFNVVIVTGEIDADSMPALQASLSEFSPDSHILLDMSRVRFMDCRGLRVLLTQRKRMTEAGGSLQIRHSSPAVQRVMRRHCIDRHPVRVRYAPMRSPRATDHRPRCRRSWLMETVSQFGCAPGEIRTPAHGSGNQCSIP